MKKILAIGEIIWDIYPAKKVIGGAPLNFAAHAALCGAKSALVSAVGDDELGKSAIECLSYFGVDTKYVKTAQEPTGQCIVSLDENSVPSYDVLRGVAFDNISLTENDISSINSECFDALYFGSLIQREYVSRQAVQEIVKRCSSSEIICDVNLRPGCYDRETVCFCLENATVLKISIEEEPLLRALRLYDPKGQTLKDIALAICESYENVKVVLLTLGKDGSYALDARSKKEYFQQAIGDKVVSTVGAGDSFAAAWITAFLEDLPLEVCMKRASALSGFVVAHLEAVPMYSLEEIKLII